MTLILHQDIYIYIHENGSWDEWNRIEVQKYSCTDRVEGQEIYFTSDVFYFTVIH